MKEKFSFFVFKKSPTNETYYKSESTNVAVEARNQKKATCKSWSTPNRKIIPRRIITSQRKCPLTSKTHDLNLNEDPTEDLWDVSTWCWCFLLDDVPSSWLRRLGRSMAECPLRENVCKHTAECGSMHVTNAESNLPQLYNVRSGASLARSRLMPSGGWGEAWTSVTPPIVFVTVRLRRFFDTCFTRGSSTTMWTILQKDLYYRWWSPVCSQVLYF